MSELIDVRADAVGPGECVCVGGAVIMVTGVSASEGFVDLHTEFGPALRFVRHETVAVVIEETAAA
jgi:hypothetical protein